MFVLGSISLDGFLAVRPVDNFLISEMPGVATPASSSSSSASRVSVSPSLDDACESSSSSSLSLRSASSGARIWLASGRTKLSI